MVTIDVFASLSMIKQEVDVTLDQAQTALQSFVDNPEGTEQLVQCQGHLVQLAGIFRLIGIDGAALLLDELQNVTGLAESMIASGQTEGVDNYLVVLGKSIMILQQYVEYAHAKRRLIPVVLIPAINDARRVAEKSIIPESYFFQVNTQIERQYPSDSEQNHEELTASLRRLRHMYQVGLLGMIRGGDASHARFIQRALERLDKLSGPCSMGLLWWLGLGVAEVFLEEKIVLNNTRMAVLGRVDRQIKKLVYNGLQELNQEPDPVLLKECLYIISLSPSKEGLIGELKAAFYLNSDEHINDEELQKELALMSGPGDAVIDSVAQALREELASIEDHLDLSARGVDMQEDYFQAVGSDLKRVAHTLFMLGLVDPSNLLKEQAERVSEWNIEIIDTQSGDYQAVADSLIMAEHAIAEMIRGSQPGDEQRESSISLTLLDEARHIVVVESRAGLAVAKRAISSYIDTHWDKVHLKNVPAIMNTISGGITFLLLERAAVVIQACDQYIQSLLNESDEFQPSQNDLETLADAMTSIDYYLEGLEEKKPIGDGVLELAEESVHALTQDKKAAAL